MECELLATTIDDKFDLLVRLQGTYFRFTIKPHDQPSTLANTRNYAFQDEAVIALKNKGYDYAEAFVQASIDELKLRNAPPAGQIFV